MVSRILPVLGFCGVTGSIWDGGSRSSKEGFVSGSSDMADWVVAKGIKVGRV
jgi:hypothetical protein